MPLARWRKLCLDATDGPRVATFWAGVLGLRREQLDGGASILRGARPHDTIWVNVVPEPKTAKHRVHFDLRAAALQPIVDAGARVLRPEGDGGIGWTVLSDPEGGEFCVFRRDDLPVRPPAALYEVVVDTADSPSSRELAGWWAEVLGGRRVDDGRGFWWVEGIPDAPIETLDVVPVPEPKTAKNRLHWDVECADVAALVDAGATMLRQPDTEIRWHVLADPQGNEFCAFPPDDRASGP